MTHITKITVANIKGIKYQEILPGALTVISGDNSTGKSSLLSAITLPFEGGHDQGLLRHGETRGEVSIYMEDGAVISAVVKPTSTTISVTRPDGKKEKRYREYIDKLAEGFAFNPTALINCLPKDRAQFLLEAMPINFTMGEIREVIPNVEELLPIGFKSPTLTLDEFMALRVSIYEQRTEVNRALGQAANTIKEMQAALPADTSEDWGERLADTNRALNEINSVHLNETSTIIENANRRRAELQRAATARIDELQKQIADIRTTLAADIGAVATEEAGFKTALNDEKVAAEAPFIAQRTEAVRHIEDIGRAKHARELLANAEQMHKQTQRASDLATAALAKVDALKGAKLSALPVPGVEVREGDVWVDGVPWRHVNTARQYALCFELAILRKGDCGVMICDRAEAMSDTTFAAFKEAAAGAGLQIIMARVVADQQLLIETTP